MVGPGTSAKITDGDIRNCHYAGIRISRDAGPVEISRCRISGAAWHGIRYDDVSPFIRDNRIFSNARSGIYASGRTAAQVSGNVFFANEMNGMSCWTENHDVILRNTFHGNLREGLAVLGGSEPEITYNIFSAHPVALLQGPIRGDESDRYPGMGPWWSGTCSGTTNRTGRRCRARPRTPRVSWKPKPVPLGRRAPRPVRKPAVRRHRPRRFSFP